MFEADGMASTLGIRLEAAAPGTAQVSMTVSENMLQGHATCHGGAIFTLADTAFAIACNGYGEPTVAQMCSITFIAPAHCGDRLTALAIEKSRTGRSGIYDISVSRKDGSVIAEFRGHSRTVK